MRILEKLMKKDDKGILRITDRVPASPYTYNVFSFAFVAAVGKERVQCCEFNDCREVMNATVRRHFMKETRSEYRIFKDVNGRKPDAPIDTDNLRLLLTCTPRNPITHKNKLFSGKAALNVLEDVAGWKRSAITAVKHSKQKHCWMVTGPGEWMYTPQLLSLATWILRLGTRYGPLTSENIDDLEKEIQQLHQKNCLHGNKDVTQNARCFHNKLKLIMENFEEIFGDIEQKEHWASKSLDTNNFFHGSGLLSFIISKLTYSDEAKACQKRFLDLCHKNNVEVIP